MSIKIDLNCIVNGGTNQTNFTTQLLRLILRSDGANRYKISVMFPNAVETVLHWRETGEILDLPQD